MARPLCRHRLSILALLDGGSSRQVLFDGMHSLTFSGSIGTLALPGWREGSISLGPESLDSLTEHEIHLYIRDVFTLLPEQRRAGVCHRLESETVSEPQCPPATRRGGFFTFWDLKLQPQLRGRRWRSG
jgi:hypothetical protein